MREAIPNGLCYLKSNSYSLARHRNLSNLARICGLYFACGGNFLEGFDLNTGGK